MAQYKLDLTKKAFKFLDTLPPKQFRQVVKKILLLLNNPKPNDYKQLIGYPEFLRADVGEYRIIYKIKQEDILIVLIGKRNDDQIYKDFNNLC